MFKIQPHRCRYRSSATSGWFLPRVGSIPTMGNASFFHPILQFIVFFSVFAEHFKVIKSAYLF
jgi:hypothetical protein